MNEVLAPSATILTVSNSANPEWNSELFIAAAEKAANRRTAKGMTRERQMLKRNQLISSVCADYRAHFTALYGKTDRLPTAIFAEVESAVDKVISKHLSQVHGQNIISLRRAFHVKINDLEVSERVAITGENPLTLKEQHLGATLAIGQAEKRLKELEAKPTPNLDAERDLKIRIVKLNNVRLFIENELKSQETAKSESAK